MRTLKTNTNEFNNKVNTYILDCINSEDIDLRDDKDKLAFLAVQFDSEFNHPYNVKFYPNLQNRLANWFMGLPSCFNIAFENYRILEIAKQFGSLSNQATDKQEDAVLANWFNLIAMKTIRLAAKNNITIG